MSKAKQLTGQALADEYAKCYAHWGNVWARDLGGGWIEIGGDHLKPAPEMAAQYPNGWSMLDRHRYSKVRARLAQGWKAP